MKQRLKPGMLLKERAELLEAVIREANHQVYSLSSTSEQYAGMGTTVVAAIADPKHVVIGHIGDSRAYLFSGGKMKQLTEDHSLVNELLRSGQINAEEAAMHPRRNVLVRALGTDPEVDIDMICQAWQEHDVLLLCTDGLSGLVQKETIIETMNSDSGLNEKAAELVEKALEAGGDDNVTVVLLINEPDDMTAPLHENDDQGGEEP